MNQVNNIIANSSPKHRKQQSQVTATNRNHNHIHNHSNGLPSTTTASTITETSTSSHWIQRRQILHQNISNIWTIVRTKVLPLVHHRHVKTSTKRNTGGSRILYAFAILILSYGILVTMVHTVHIYYTTDSKKLSSANNATLLLPQSYYSKKVPLYITKPEHDILSRIMGISSLVSVSKRSTWSYFTSIFRNNNNHNHNSNIPQTQQCMHTSSPAITTADQVQVPPPLIRKGKIRHETDSEYQMKALSLVNNIRVLLGTAQQLGQQQLYKMNNTNAITGSIHSNMLQNAIIMDYGCGSGRLLIGLLLAQMAEPSLLCFQKYIGIDVNMKEIRWLTKTYSNINRGRSTKTSALKQRILQVKPKTDQLTQPKDQRRLGLLLNDNNENDNTTSTTENERYQFIHVNVYNDRYNKNGNKLDTDSIQINDRMILPVSTYTKYINTVDILVIRSVFTHMVTSDVYHHLRVLYFLLKPNTGVMIISLLVNPEPDAPVETVKSFNNHPNNNNTVPHNIVYISKHVFENILYETGYTVLLYMKQWNINEDVYIVSTLNGKKQDSLLLSQDMNNNRESEDEEDEQQEENV